MTIREALAILHSAAYRDFSFAKQYQLITFCRNALITEIVREQDAEKRRELERQLDEII